MDKLDSIILVFPSDVIESLPDYTKDLITIVEILNPFLVVIVFTKCGQASIERKEFGLFRD